MDPIFYDVNRLMDLARNNPAELERLRHREVENLIKNAPERLQHRLRGLQFQIDCNRRIHSNPLGACIAISRMMLDSLQELNKTIHGDIPSMQIAETSSQRPRVIPFPVLAN